MCLHPPEQVWLHYTAEPASDWSTLTFSVPTGEGAGQLHSDFLHINQLAAEAQPGCPQGPTGCLHLKVYLQTTMDTNMSRVVHKAADVGPADGLRTFHVQLSQ